MTAIDLISTAILPLELFFDKTPLGHATGFLWRSAATRQLYIVTSWHVVSAKDFFTRKNIHKSGGRPNRLLTRLQIPGRFEKQPWDIQLRDSQDNALWLVHPGSRYDIALIPFSPPQAEQLVVGLYPLNEYANDELLTEIGMDVFVLGYPFGVSPPALPVWKRGSIASEPEIVRLTNQGYMLVDTASRSGMSGGPVIQRSWGHHLVAVGRTSMDGRNRSKFLGVYSGRLPTDHPHEAQIGLVWDKSYIEEIIAGNCRDEEG
jgi:S1-C subfamily serine protease